MTRNEDVAIATALDDVKLPDWVVDRVATGGHDATGDPAIWVLLILDDKAEVDTDEVMEVRAVVHRVLREANSEVWPYIRFRTKSEQTELDRGPEKP